jgi:hypothetical protein
MEYFLGSLITFVIVIVASYLLKNERQDSKTFTFLKYSQSYTHDIMAPYLPTNNELALLTGKTTQSIRHDKSNQVRVLIARDRAYWIKDNAFYTAEVQNGEVLKETATPVDTMAMDRVQLDEMVFIVEQLTRGIENDSRNTGQ